jgi:hypothetical protein
VGSQESTVESGIFREVWWSNGVSGKHIGVTNFQ